MELGRHDDIHLTDTGSRHTSVTLLSNHDEPMLPIHAKKKYTLQAGLWGDGCSGDHVKCNGNVLIGCILLWTNERKEDLKSRYHLSRWTIRTILCGITLMLRTTGCLHTSTLESEYNITVMKPLIQRATLETGASYHMSGASICQTIFVASPTGQAVPPRSQICHR